MSPSLGTARATDGRRGRQVAVEARQRHRAHHPARPVDPGSRAGAGGRSSHQRRWCRTRRALRLLRLGHPVERREHHRDQVLRRLRPPPGPISPGRSTQQSAVAWPAVVVDGRQAGAGAAEELVQRAGGRGRSPAARGASTPPPRGRASSTCTSGLGGVGLLRAVREVAVPARWRRCQWPATGMTPKSVYSVRSARRTGRHHERGRGPGVGSPGQQRSSSAAADARPWCAGSDHQLGQLLHLAEARRRGEAHEPVAVLAEQ